MNTERTDGCAELAGTPTPRVSILTFGCRANQYEGDAMRRSLGSADSSEAADVYVLNACAVTALAERKARQAARRIRREHRGARIVLIGCLADAVAKGLTQFDEADLLAGNTWKPHVLEAVTRVTAGEHGLLPGRTVGSLDEERSAGPSDRVRAVLKIQDGCSRLCTYCRPTQVRGPSRSKSIAAAVDEAAALVAGGCPELVLTGINLAEYAPPGGSLASLMRAILRVPRLRRLRLASLNPAGVTDELLSVFEDPRACPHFHIPLQSGDDGVLRRMRRGYTVEAYRRCVARIAEAIPPATFGTDIIVGFPGEDAAAFARTLDAVAAIDYANLHVFRYSERPGTAAADLPGRVPESVKRVRAETLDARWAIARRRLLDSRLSTTQDVLVEEGRDGRWRGHTPDYLYVTFGSHGEIPIGCVRSVRIVGTADDRLEGEDRDRDDAGRDHPAGQR